MSFRIERLESQFKQDLGEIFQKYQNGSIITITAVRVTPDLSIARVYLSILAPGESEKVVFSKLEGAKTEIRTALARKIRHQVRKIPDLQFFMDDTSEYVNKIESLFAKIRKDRDEHSSSDEEE
ncbi:MAG: 30S ribosome-binding factor RbfA [Balneolaceae bacterium]|jgi:ribosome-binding factor A|nr:MAG: 30S ribosome-binding factor RbfA [Balneolaceae bacterium]